MPFRRSFTPVLDGGLVNIGDGTVRKQTLKIDAGEYTPPIWLRTEAGLVVPVSELPFQTVLEAGQLETLSDDPVAWPPADLLFNSDWSFGTGPGTDTQVITDDHKWDVFVSLSDSEVIEAIGLGFPAGMANVLRVEWGTTVTSEILEYTALPIPGVDESLYYRHHYRHVADENGNGTHEIQDGASFGALNWWWGSTPVPGGDWQCHLGFGATANPHPHNRWGDNIILSPTETYRREHRIRRATSTTFFVELRIYNSAGTLLYTEDDFEDINGGGGMGAHEFTFVDVNYLAGLRCGTNDPGGGAPANQTHSYQGGFCVRTEDWCGRYRNGV